MVLPRVALVALRCCVALRCVALRCVALRCRAFFVLVICSCSSAAASYNKLARGEGKRGGGYRFAAGFSMDYLFPVIGCYFHVRIRVPVSYRTSFHYLQMYCIRCYPSTRA